MSSQEPPKDMVARVLAGSALVVAITTMLFMLGVERELDSHHHDRDYSEVRHEHDDYAEDGHDHSNYAEEYHTHSRDDIER